MTPRRQALLLAATLVVALLRVATYDAPPGVRSRDMAAVAGSARARPGAHVVVRGDIAHPEYSYRFYAEGAASFGDGSASLTVSLPGIVSAEGPPPEYELRVAGRSDYVRGLGGTTWYAFPERSVGVFVPDPIVILDMAARTPAVRRVGGGSVRGTACDHYRGEVPAGVVRLPEWLTHDGVPPVLVDAWVAADGMPRRMAVSARAKDGNLLRVTLDLSRFDTPVAVETPDVTVGVDDSTAAFRALGEAAS